MCALKAEALDLGGQERLHRAIGWHFMSCWNSVLHIWRLACDSCI